jgi:type IV pilus assembly protein PilQ
LYDRRASVKHFDFAGIGLNDKGPSGPDGKPLFKSLIGWSLNFVPAAAKAAARIPFVFGDRTLSTKRLNLELNVAENRNEIKTILKPSLLVHNDETAEILVGEELPHQVRLDEAIEGKLTNVTSVNYKDIGMKIKVKPTVAPSLQSVFLDIFVENSLVAKPTIALDGVGTTGATGTQFNYTIQTSRSKNRVLLKSGQTTLIGGLITEGTAKEKTGVPYLQDIPILGLLFQGRHKKIVDKQLLIFITPTLVDLEQA